MDAEPSDEAENPGTHDQRRRRFSWEKAQLQLPPGTSVSDELLRQRGREIVPAPGLDPIPGPEEWQRRMKLLRSILDEWMADESGYDEEAWPELKAALEQNRVEAGEYRKPFGE